MLFRFIKIISNVVFKILKTSYLLLLFNYIFSLSFSAIMRFLFNDDVCDLLSYFLGSW